jgi:hypothetical protein
MKLVDFSYNIVFTALFICFRMRFYIFSILTKMVHNKVGMQRGSDGIASWDRWLQQHTNPNRWFHHERSAKDNN